MRGWTDDTGRVIYDRTAVYEIVIEGRGQTSAERDVTCFAERACAIMSQTEVLWTLTRLDEVGRVRLLKP